MTISNNSTQKLNILYVFGGEKAQGAEIVIERLMNNNIPNVNAHLILSPGKFADDLIKSPKPYKITLIDDLKKLNRSSNSRLRFYGKALSNYFSISAKVFKYIKNNNINIVHANTIVPASYLIPLIACSGICLPRLKWLWSDHDMNNYAAIENYLSKLCVSLYTKTLVVSGAVKKKYKDNDKVEVLYNGLNIDEFKPDYSKRSRFRKNLKIDDDIILIGIAANINPDKGQLELIHIFHELSLTYPKIGLIIAGSYASQFPEYRQEVELAIKGKKKIIHIGYVDTITDFYNGCDIIVNNSNNYRSESLGTSIYEAMACQTIVLAADTGGTPEIVTDGEDGFLFKTEDMHLFKQKLEYIINNFANMKNVKCNARAKVIAKFNISYMLNRYNNIISKLN